MTQENDNQFREMFESHPDADTVAFVPWGELPSGGFAAATPSLEGAAFVPAFHRLDPEAERASREIAAIEAMHEQALQEIALKEAALSERAQALDEAEEALAKEKGEIDAHALEIMIQAESLRSIAGDFEEMKKGWWRENADEVVDFALDLVDALVMDRSFVDAGLVVRHIRSVLDELKIAEPVLVRIAPDDLAALKRSGVADVRALLDDPHVTWTGDAALKRGEVYVDTSQFRLDASLATAIKNLRDDLKASDRRPENGRIS